MSKKKKEKKLGKRAAMDFESTAPFEELKELYEKETDRGAALLVAAYAEAALEVALRRCMVQDAAIDALFDDSRGPLGTFSAKIRMAFALGILPDVMCRDLDLVRTIRNDFAHHPGEVTFETPSIRQRCEATIMGAHARTLERQTRERQRKRLQGGTSIADSPRTAREFYLNAVAFPVAMLFVNMRRQVQPKALELQLTVPVKKGPTQGR